MKPGDEIWLNGIFQVNLPQDTIVDVLYRISKNGETIYSATKNIEGTDNIGQIYSQQYVDTIKNVEKDVTYSLVASVPSGDTGPQVFGPITLTGAKQ
ncbi:hypothetical protein VQL36_19665 [Chengkuizengella sp. SCS-71B]|uniref:hypothetical protein n=1 Tax=Chengkuizengella sp. SCS-71B TaxID=3115290 RepID=UPI0032C22A58